MSLKIQNEFKTHFSKSEIEKLQKTRIIQKNLVHLQNLPDSLLNENILIQKEYLGQFGKILKIYLVKKTNINLKKKSNSAYITFSNKEEASYCILTLDSLVIENCLIRAFFGTSKYCIHFLNNIECYNKDKCMFIHYLANPNEILGNCNFNYNDHLNLAKKIINYGSNENKNYILNLKINYYTFLPNVKNIYLRDDFYSDFNKTNYSSSNSSNSSDSNKNIICFKNQQFCLFKFKEESRFFSKYNNNNNIIYNNSLCDVSEKLKKLIDDIFIRFSFFNKFSSFNNDLIEFCKKKYNLINDNWIDYELNNNNLD